MYILTYLYVLAEISAYHLQLKCMGGHFLSGPSLPREYYRTVLSDNTQNSEIVVVGCDEANL